MSLEAYTRKSDGLITYSVKFFFHGRCYRRSLGPVSLKAAKLAERQARVDAAHGTFDAPATPRPVPTLKAFAPVFLDSYRTDARPASVDTYASRIDNHVQPLMGDLRLDQITPRVLDEYCTVRRGEGAAVRTVNAELAVVSALLTQAVTWGDLSATARAHVTWLRTEERSIRVLTPAEEGRLILAATPRLRPLIQFALVTGLRRQELVSLTWDDIDWTRREVIVTAERAKSRRRRAVPLNRQALSILHDLHGTPSRHERLFGYKSLRSSFYAATRNAGLPGISCHSLRHAFATRALERGVAIHVLKVWLGHSSVKVTERYLHMTESYGRDAIELLRNEFSHQQQFPSA